MTVAHQRGVSKLDSAENGASIVQTERKRGLLLFLLQIHSHCGSHHRAGVGPAMKNTRMASVIFLSFSAVIAACLTEIPGQSRQADSDSTRIQLP